MGESLPENEGAEDETIPRSPKRLGALRFLAFGTPLVGFIVALLLYLNTFTHFGYCLFIYLVSTACAGFCNALASDQSIRPDGTLNKRALWRRTTAFFLLVGSITPIVGLLISIAIFFIWVSGIH